ncbi:hypothetical protein ACFQ1M_06345 [Sungkyunkwania multivorans]|uniref:Uncharacterized protein n=1 Tax=Sungkyunkwania multivorans TaxID=1173618 RepID=A0ABW3CWC0_9FLAO
MLTKALKFFHHLLVLVVLTILTQVGGIIYLLCLWLFSRIPFDGYHKWLRRGVKLLVFSIAYIFFSFAVVPLVASTFFDKEPLPFSGEHLRPLNVGTVLLNRHYTTKDLKETMTRSASKMATAYPGTITLYLDANFPLFEKFPLLPHISHNDGKKLDLAFYYRDSKTKEMRVDSPSWLGYGVFEGPKEGEYDMPDQCAKRGKWQYSILGDIVPQHRKDNYIFDAQRTKALISILAKEAAIKKIFIEPHLKTRLGLTSAKVRFHGCQAVRHDDHIHIQL